MRTQEYRTPLRGCLFFDRRGLVGHLVLEAELEHVAAAFPLMVGEPLAPLFDVKAGEGGVVFVPFGDQLLEVQTKGARGCIGLSGNFLPDRRAATG